MGKKRKENKKKKKKQTPKNQQCNISQGCIELFLKRKKSKQTSAPCPADEATWLGICHEQAFLQALETQDQNNLPDRKLTIREKLQIFQLSLDTSKFGDSLTVSNALYLSPVVNAALHSE